MNEQDGGGFSGQPSRTMKDGPCQKTEERLATFLLLVIMMGTAVSVLSRREYWPFCTYPMFRELRVRDTVSHYRLVGRDEAGHRVVLGREDDLGWMIPSRVQGLLYIIADEPDRKARDASMKFLHKQGRASEFPTLELYRFTWPLDSIPLPPARRELIYECTF
jgi:hypothetical protein